MTRVKQARGLLDFLVGNTSSKSPYGAFLRNEVESLRHHEDSYLFHEHLETVNDPIYFHEFAERVAAHGLQYLGESDIATMYIGHLQPNVAATLERISTDWIQMEQYMDFLRNRMFRQTLLCRAGLKIDRELKPESLQRLLVSSSLTPLERRIDIRSQSTLKFKLRNGNAGMETADPMMKAAIVSLAEMYPQRLPFPEIADRAYNVLHREPVFSAESRAKAIYELGRSILRAYVDGLVNLHAMPAPFTTEIDNAPLASAVARDQARTGNIVTNLQHETIMLHEAVRQILIHLDGRHTHGQKPS